jgi:hypothetical protein
VQQVIGAIDHPATADDLERFIEHVHRPFRAADPRAVSTHVYGGERAAAALIDEAERQGVWLRSFIEYQGIIDFSGYTRRLVDRLQTDPNYLPEQYVPQSADFEIGLDRDTSANALETVLAWLHEPNGRFVLVLADFGTGKSILQRQIALSLA